MFACSILLSLSVFHSVYIEESSSECVWMFQLFGFNSWFRSSFAERGTVTLYSALLFMWVLSLHPTLTLPKKRSNARIP